MDNKARGSIQNDKTRDDIRSGLTSTWFNKEFILTTDTSSICIETILFQKDSKGKEDMISTFSKAFDKA